MANRGKSVPHTVWSSSRDGAIAELKRLLAENHGAGEINRGDSFSGATAVYIASVQGHLEVVKLLIKHGADINKTANNGWPPLKVGTSGL